MIHRSRGTVSVPSRRCVGFGGSTPSGIGREGGRDGLLPYLENKSILLDEKSSDFPTWRP